MVFIRTTRSLLVAGMILLLPATLRAQRIQEEKLSGYKGGFNKHISVPDKAFSFIIMGDWGRNGQYYQQDVAAQMGRTAASIDAAFIVAVGDNFYPSGVQSTQDPQWNYSYEQVYRSQFLQCNWYVALGNHDYKGNIQAEIDYTKISRRWYMPAPYYAKKIRINDSEQLLLVVMDTDPYIDSYYGKDDEMGRNVAQQDTAAQRRWLAETLGDTDPSIKWRLVAGHHPLYSGGKRKAGKDTEAMKRKFQAMFDQYKVDAFLCGHEHDLQVVKPEGHYTTQLLSGAGCEVRPTGNTEGTLFAASEPGFIVCSINGNTMLVQVVKTNGKIAFKTTISKH